MPDERLTNLPAHLPRLIGREADVPEVRGRLLDAERGLLTLTGAGGSGKTALALEVAGGLLDEFEDGAWLVELAPLADPALVPQAIAGPLGVRESPERPLLDGLVAFLRPRALLLVLDNCEHLVEACASAAAALLGACPHLRILATSREPLRIPGEVTWPVPTLTVPDALQPATPGDLGRSAAARLFVERARAAQPRFAVTPWNALAVARVCIRLDGLPLALELAAARVRALSVEQLAARLDDSFRLLVGGSRTAPSRQQTLEATLDWSHALLTQSERIVFRRLAVFAGGWDLEAAEAACAGGDLEQADVLEILARLVDKSLAVAETHDEQPRYRLLEPIRQYAAGRLAAGGDREATRERHAGHYLALAERADAEVWGGRSYAPFGNPRQLAWMACLEREHANLRAALAWADSAGEAEVLLRLAVAVWGFWFIYGHTAEGLRWQEATLARRAGLPARLVALALARTSLLAWILGDYEGEVRLAGESVSGFEALGDTANAALALNWLGVGNGMRGEFAAGRRHLERSIALFRELGDAWGIGIGLYDLGKVVRQHGEPDAARALIEEGLPLLRAAGDLGQVVEALTDLAGLAQERRDAQQVEALAREALGLLRQLHSPYFLPDCLELLAGAVAARGEAMRAARLFGAAAAVREATGAVLEPSRRPAHERQLGAVRAALGADAFAVAWEAAAKLAPAAAIEEALSPPRPPAVATTTHPAGDLALLTAREREVALLVARGLSNKQIAEALVIAEGTTAVHVHNIIGKLGLANRAQVAVWAAAHDPGSP